MRYSLAYQILFLQQVSVGNTISHYHHLLPTETYQILFLQHSAPLDMGMNSSEKPGGYLWYSLYPFGAWLKCSLLYWYAILLSCYVVLVMEIIR